jgi:hypothetical protein
MCIFFTDLLFSDSASTEKMSYSGIMDQQADGCAKGK